jgi:nitrogen fixation protein NifX
MKVAFATHDLKSVNAGFDDASFFVIYDVDTQRFVCQRAVRPEDDDETGTFAAIETRLETVRDCAILCVRYFESPSTARLIGANVHSVVVSGVLDIQAILRRLQVVLRGHTPPWLKKIYVASDPPAMKSNVIPLSVRQVR